MMCMIQSQSVRNLLILIIVFNLIALQQEKVGVGAEDTTNTNNAAEGEISADGGPESNVEKKNKGDGGGGGGGDGGGDDDDDGGDGTDNDDGNDDGETVVQNLAELSNLTDTTALYGGPCDPEFEKTHVDPIYSGLTLNKIWNAKLALNEHIAKNPELAKKSCYGVLWDPDVGYVENHMQCTKCQDRLDRRKTFDCCKCLNEEPLVFEKQPFSICKLKDSVIDTPCSYEMFEAMYKDVHQPFYEKIAKAQQRRDYVAAMVEYMQDYEAFYLGYGPAAARLTCRSQSNNLVCTEENLCDCVDVAPYFEYVHSRDDKNCIAKDGTICYLLVKTEAQKSEHLSKCRSNVFCKNAVPGLYCDDLDDPDCQFEVLGGVDENGNETAIQLLYWALNACNGPIKGKNSLLKSSASSYHINSSLFISILFFVLFQAIQ